MSLYAFDAIDDAIKSTRAFLWPFDLSRWAKLAFIMFFIGGVGGFNPLQFAGGSPSSTGPDTPGAPGAPEAMPTLGGSELAIIAAIVGLIVLLALVFQFIGSVMEFVFVESLRQESVRLRQYWRNRWKQGLRLFGFRLGLGLLTLAIIGVLLVVVLAPVLFDAGEFSLGLLLIAIPVFILVAIASGVVNGFTTMFVVPIMIAEDRKVLSAWRQFWPTLTDQWRQYAAYAVISFVLQIAAGIAASIALLPAMIALAIPLVIVGFVGVQLLATAQLAGWIVIGLAVAVFILAIIVFTLFISVPLQTFLRYYALLVLGDTNDAFDLIPDRRRAVRE